ncbi:MAG: VOC family protein [Ilumatobacteraceae bacterium]
MQPDEFAGTSGLDDWRYVLESIRATFRFATFTDAAGFVAAVGAAADAADHHPEVALRYPGIVDITLGTHDRAAVTTLDVDVARALSSLAASAGAVASPTAAQGIEIAIDTVDADRIRPFWAAVLGYVAVRGGSLADPARLGPPVWFQQMDEPRTERQRFHIDVSVPHDAAEARVASALAAGGRLVSDAYARSWWVLADADGNEACVCTWQDRS